MAIERVIIEIENPRIDGEAKFEKALNVLSKAVNVPFEFEHKHKEGELSVYPAVNEYIDDIDMKSEDDLQLLWEHICRSWLGIDMQKAGKNDPFKLNGKLFISPKTGKALTIGEWSIIKKDLSRVFKFIYKDKQEMIVKRAIAMGKILQEMEPKNRYLASANNLDIDLFTDTVSKDAVFKNTLAWGNVHAGELIEDITARSRKQIVQSIMSAINQKMSTSDLQESLFDDFASLNKDWRRIAETETATNFNNGYLISELKEADKRGDDEYVFVVGISGAGACPFCAGHVDGQIFVLLEEAPASGETITVNGEVYTAIWPGKSNVGRNRKDWWVSSGTQHPHCRCTFSRIPSPTNDYTKKIMDRLAD